MIKTSKMEAITNPERFGYKHVRIFFGEIRPCQDPCVCKGDLLQDAKGNLYEFISREGSELNLKPFEV